MKKILLVFFILSLVGLFFTAFKYFSIINRSKISSSNKLKNPSPTVINPTAVSYWKQKETKSIFIPYWSLNGEEIGSAEADYHRLIYFGISADQTGINKADAGYLNLKKFININSSKISITLRMLDSETNFSILKNPEIQKKIIDETIDIAEKYKFSGIVLDLELFSLFNNEISIQINNFVQLFYTNTKGHNLHFAITLYGDNFYRKRPYDAGFLSKNSDEILVMAYDFHKKGGEPGPNFPLEGKAKYGYDFKQMIDDYSKFIPADKLTVIFGMYGYEWLVDEKKRPIRPAKSLSLNEINKKFFYDNNFDHDRSKSGNEQMKCSWENCVARRDEISQEMEINYIYSMIKDNFGYMDMYIVWFEDEESVKIKNQFLKEKGINSIAFWAWGYF